MPKKILSPYAAPDMSALARALAASLNPRIAKAPQKPLSHVELLNALARASGARNYQAWRVAQAVPARSAPPAASALTSPLALEEVKLSHTQQRLLRVFDERGVMLRWPTQRAVQKLAVWLMWARFAKRRTYTESEVNAVLKPANAFDDHVMLRRELVNEGLLARERDGSRYQRIERVPPEEVKLMMKIILKK